MWIRTGITSLDLILASVALLLSLRLLTRSRIPKGLRLPPGPRGRLIVGNAPDMPGHHEWETFSQWAKTYGDLVYIKVFGKSMVFVNSLDVAYELFEKRSSIYSDRCNFPMLNDLMGWDWNIAFMHYGEWWRRHRRVVHQKFHPTAAAEYRPIQAKHTRQLLRRLHESPSDLFEHIRYTAGAIIMEIVYGIKVLAKDDSYMETAEEAASSLATAGNAGTFLVDTLPILKYVPEWIPGAGFRKQARVWRESITRMSVAPFHAVKEALSAGTAEPSFTSSLLEEIAFRSDTPAGQEEVIRGAGSTLYAAGTHTTVSALHTFMLAMVLYPEAQKKAQQELDEVLGPSRLPQFEDRVNLPYIDAICKEVLRWHPIVPLGVAHRVTQDDIIDKYFIPSGSIIFGNSWEILHSEAAYGSNTDMFIPERFLEPRAKYPNAAFGYGRRICPGRYMADNSMFIAIAYILKVFDIAPARDSSGKELPVSAAFTSGFLSHPEPFQCTIKARSDSAARLILQPERDSYL